MNLTELKTKTTEDLNALAKGRGISGTDGMRRQDLVLAILRDESRSGQVRGSGVLEVLADGFGFLRAPDSNYTPGPDDIYVSPSQIRRFHLRTGDSVAGVVRPPKENERYYALLKVEKINAMAPEERKKKLFDNLTPVYPNERLRLEFDGGDLATRILELFSPIGKGQRALILAPPRAGKSGILRSIARALEANHSRAKVLLLLIGERPEEVTEITRTTPGEVVSSSFDDPASRHGQVAELVLEKAKRVAESGGDAVILLDSMTRLARAFAAGSSSPPRTADAGVLHKCKRFFGAARNLEDGGSLTVVATADADPSSPLDAALADELLEAANATVHLDSALLEKRIFPCIDVIRSATRHEERLFGDEQLERIRRFRAATRKLGPIAAMEQLRDRMSQHESNEALLAAD